MADRIFSDNALRIGRERRRARRHIRRLGLPNLPTLQDALDCLAALRGRPVSVTARTLPRSISGFCAQLDHEDIIVVDENAPCLTQVLTACHELAHLLCGHVQTQNGLFDAATAADLLPGVRADVSRAVLMGRSRYKPPLEREAEFVATQLVTMLDLRRERIGTTQISKALAHRGPGV